MRRGVRLALILTLSCSSICACAADHLSNVYFAGSGETVLADVNGTTGLVGRVGVPFSADIKYQVGWTEWRNNVQVSHKSEHLGNSCFAKKTHSKGRAE